MVTGAEGNVCAAPPMVTLSPAAFLMAILWILGWKQEPLYFSGAVILKGYFFTTAARSLCLSLRKV